VDATLSLFSDARNAQIPPQIPVRMSSREIAKLTGKDHKHVLRDIRAMLCDLYPRPGIDPSTLSFEEKGAANSLDSIAQKQAIENKGLTMSRDNLGDISEILLPKRETLVLISGYRVDLRARIIDRWQELETQLAGPALVDLTDPGTAALALAERYRQYAAEYQLRQQREREIEALEKQKAIMAPKAQIADRIATADGLHTMLEAAKILQTGRTRLFVLLRLKQIFITDNLPYQRYIELGYFVVKEKTYFEGGFEHLYSQVLVTGKGLNWLARLIDNDVMS
jgi:phage antirepressor YoqD-like protein